MGALPFRVGLRVGALVASVTAVRVACQVTAESFCSAWHRGRGWPSPGEMAGVLHTFPWDLPSGPFASTPDCPPATPPGLHLCAGGVRTEAALCFPNWGASKPSGTGWGGPARKLPSRCPVLRVRQAALRPGSWSVAVSHCAVALFTFYRFPASQVSLFFFFF